MSQVHGPSISKVGQSDEIFSFFLKFLSKIFTLGYLEFFTRALFQFLLEDEILTCEVQGQVRFLSL